MLPNILAVAMALTLAVSPVEIIDRVLAVVNGVIVTQTDVFGAMAFGLVDPQPSGSGGVDPIQAALDQLIDRELVLAEVNRYAPPEPAEEAIAARADAIRARFPSPEAYQRAMASTGYTNERIHAAARDALRIETYFDQRFGAAVQPADRQILIADWKAGLRRRADVTIQYQPRTRM
ncbi:MAG TPA: hypothetical protein VHI98_25820 [Vicinamibacterales bacterium]|nr:hypothetical protein [Vicinamibacterales bacterium]